MNVVNFTAMSTSPSKQILNIGGIAVSVFSLPGATAPSAPVAALFLLHGRTRTSADVAPIAELTLQWTDEHRKAAGVQGHDLIVVTLVRFRSKHRSPVSVPDSDGWTIVGPTQPRRTDCGCTREQRVEGTAPRTERETCVSHICCPHSPKLQTHRLGPG